MGNEELYDRIEAYLSKRMTPEETEAFREELTVNSELAAELALHKGVAEAMQEEEELEDLGRKIRAIVQKDGKSVSVTTKKSRFTLPISFRVAAAISLLIIAAVAAYFYFQSGPSSTQALYAQFIDYPSSIYEEQVLRAGDMPSLAPAIAQLDSLWKKADEGYQAERNEEALVLLEEIASLEVTVFQQVSSRLHYYRGILQAKAEQFSAAIASLDQVRTNYTEDAKWKKALLLLQVEGRREEALSILKDISTTATPRQEDAIELLKSLSSPN